MTTREMNDRIIRALPARLRSDNPAAAGEYIRSMTEQAVGLSDGLKEELIAWLDNRPFAGYRVRSKYTVKLVLKTRNDPRDVIGALLALDAYEKDERKEALLWRTRL